MFSVVAIVLAAGIFIAYSPALSFAFILDDHRFLSDQRLQSAGHVWEYFTSYVWAQFPGGPSSFYRPVFILWLRANFIVNEMSTWGWHFFSIVKHVAVAVLLGLLVWKLLRDRIAALLAATLFALHPAQAESVAWTTVPDPLMAAAVLGAVLLYLKYVEYFSRERTSDAVADGKKSRRQKRASSPASPSSIWLVASALVFLTALLSKETGIVLLPILFVLALSLPGRESGEAGVAVSLQSLMRALTPILPFAAATAVYFLLRFHALGRWLGTLTQHLSRRTLLLSWPSTLWFYVKVMLRPVRLRAFANSNPVDAFSMRGVLLPAVEVLGVTAILAAGVVWAWQKAGRDLPRQEAVRIHCALLLGSLILVLPILLALNLNALNPGDYLHGRYTYLSLAGLMLLLATAWHLSEKLRRPLLVGAGILAVAFTVLTVQQEGAWKDDLTLFTAAHEIAPNNGPVALSLARAHVQVALNLGEAGRCQEAVPMFDEVIQKYPQDWYAWAGLGECFVRLHDLPRAEQSLRRAAELSHEPRVAEVWQQVRARLGETTQVPAK